MAAGTKTEEKNIALTSAEEDMMAFERRQRRINRRVRWIICAVLVIAAAVLGFRYAGDFIKNSFREYSQATEYSMATENFESGKYYEAWMMFSNISDYEDSAEMALKARYAYADYLFSTEQFDKAEEIFAELGDYKDSKARIEECTMGRGILLYRQGEYEEAEKLFSAFYWEKPLAEAYHELCRFRKDCRYAGIGFNQVLHYYYIFQRYSNVKDFEGLTADPMFHGIRFFSDYTWSDGNGFVIKTSRDNTVEVEMEVTNLPWMLIEVDDDDTNNVFTIRQDDGLYVYMGSYNWFRIVSFSGYDTLEPEWVIIEDMGGNKYTLCREG